LQQLQSPPINKLIKMQATTPEDMLNIGLTKLQKATNLDVVTRRQQFRSLVASSDF
jgi:hypothetical protein